MENDPRWAGLPADSPLALDNLAPERWQQGGGAARTGGWLPFGAGARMCIGYSLALAEIKVGGCMGGQQVSLQAGAVLVVRGCLLGLSAGRSEAACWWPLHPLVHLRC